MKAFEKMEALKPDAYIMSDPGLINLVRKNFPNAEIHLTTVQANNTNWAQVEFWRDIGVKRIILSRELSLKEVKEIHEMVPDVELEFFLPCMEQYVWHTLADVSSRTISLTEIRISEPAHIAADGNIKFLKKMRPRRALW